ncbi:MAG: tRNA pseudouridine(13) synthase TruD [Pseudomonadota bacterium]
MSVQAAAWVRPAYQQKVCPEDFQVYERLDWSRTALVPVAVAAQQLWLVEKRNLNTLDLVHALAQVLDLPAVEVGYAGRKDRRALTRQWMSVPNRVAPDAIRSCLASLSGPDEGSARGLTVFGCQRKLRIGALLGNRFRLRVRLTEPLCPNRLRTALTRLRLTGFPNFFGTQRVNPEAVAAATRQLLAARAPEARRQRRGRRGGDHGWALSVVRSSLFNQVLAARLAEAPASLNELSGPLWGRGRSPADARSEAFEAAILAPSAELLDCLEHAGLRQDRRPLACVPLALDARAEQETLSLCFALPAGSYATELVVHLFRLYDETVPGQRAAHDLSTADDPGLLSGVRCALGRAY